MKIKGKPLFNAASIFLSSYIWQFFLTLIGVVFVVLIFLGYFFHWSWTGLTSKTLWDWMQLFIVSAVLAAGGFAFTHVHNKNEHKRLELERETEHKRLEVSQELIGRELRLIKKLNADELK